MLLNPKYQSQRQFIDSIPSVLEQQGTTIKEQGATIKEQDSLLRSTIKLLLDAGMTADQIAAKLGVTLEKVNHLI